MLLLVALLFTSHGSALTVSQAAEDLVASPVETVVASGRENSLWRHNRNAERIRLPEFLFTDTDTDGEYTLPPHQPLLLAGSGLFAEVQPVTLAVPSRFTRPDQARAPPLSLMH